MKTHLFSVAALLVLIAAMGCPVSLQAQAAGGAGGSGGGRLAFLSADDRAHLMKVREQVMSSNADLKAEQESLNKEREFVKGKGADASADDRKTLRENFMAHNEKMEAAMKQADPTVGPILDQVNAKMKERFQQHAGQGGGAAQ